MYEDSFSFFCLLMLPLVALLLGYAIGICRRAAEENNGEARVRQTLVEYCRENDAHVLNNITIKLDNDSTTQIDHILISKKGVFVIETKNYTGWIFGNPKSKRWTQVIYRNKQTFQNPLFQNYKHVKCVQKILGFIDPQHIHNIVVFTGDSEFKTEEIDNVCSLEELIPTIENYTEDVLSLNHVQFCVGRLEYMRLELTHKTDVEHQEYLAEKFG